MLYLKKRRNTKETTKRKRLLIMKSTAKLTEEQKRFYRVLLVRATDSTYGQPYISYALFDLIPVNSPGLGTMGVDKYCRIYIDFDWAMAKGIEYSAKVLNHEPWHILRRHAQRFEVLDARPDGKAHKHFDWNIAGDLTINGDIPDLVPEDGCHPGKREFEAYPHNRTTEEYYAQVIKDERFNPDSCKDCGQPKDKSDDKGDEKGDKSDDKGDEKGDKPGDDSDGSGESQDDGEGSGDGSEDGSGEGSGEGQGSGQGTCNSCGQDKKPGQGESNTDCGSGAGGTPREWELSPGEAPIVDEDRIEQIRETVAQDIRKYDQSNPGTIPGNMKVWAEQELESEPLDWRQLLRGQIKKAYSSWTKGKMDYRRSRPNRRQPSRDIIYPALQAPKPRMALAFDTSGSHLHKLGVVVEQTCEIVKQVGIRGRDLVAFPVDVQVGDVKRVNDPRKIMEEMVGGGGTDMRVGFEQLAKLNREEKFDIGIMFTDLQTGWPATKPEGNMVYIVVGIVDSSLAWEMSWVDKAQAAIGDWAEIVIVDINLVKVDKG